MVAIERTAMAVESIVTPAKRVVHLGSKETKSVPNRCEYLTQFFVSFFNGH